MTNSNEIFETWNWTKWKSMPAPENCKQIDGPSGPGVYQIRNKTTKEYILFGESVTCQKRMRSFFPKPFGTGTRNNERKRIFVMNNWKVLEYRTLTAENKSEAVQKDRMLKSLNIHRFNT